MSAVVAENTKFRKFQLRSKKCTVATLGDFLENMLRSLEELRLMLMSPNVAGKDKREVLLAFRAGGSTRVVNSSFAAWLLNFFASGCVFSAALLAASVRLLFSNRWEGPSSRQRCENRLEFSHLALFDWCETAFVPHVCGYFGRGDQL